MFSKTKKIPNFIDTIKNHREMFAYESVNKCVIKIPFSRVTRNSWHKLAKTKKYFSFSGTIFFAIFITLVDTGNHQGWIGLGTTKNPQKQPEKPLFIGF